MFNWLYKRAGEGSTWAGLGAAIAGASMWIPGVSDSGGAAVGQAVAEAGAQYAATGNWIGAAISIAGVVGMLLKDKGKD